MSDMFCFQCQQTAGNKCCVSVGVCGKQPDTAALQDELVYELIRLAEAAAAAGQRTQIVDRLLMDGLFITRGTREIRRKTVCGRGAVEGRHGYGFAAFHAAVRHERHGRLCTPRDESWLHG